MKIEKMNHTEFVFHFLKRLKNEITQTLNSFFIFRASEKKRKLKNELYEIRFSFSKEVKKMKLSRHFSFLRENE